MIFSYIDLIMGGAMVCGRVQDADFNANVPPPQELRIQRLDYGRPPLAQNNNNSRPPQIDTHNRANIRLSTPHQKIRVSSIDYTPMGEEKTKFPFYCPLCLYYFSDTIMETSCCKNYICHDCAVHFLKGKEGLPKNLSVVPKKLPPALRCPHCNTEKVSLSYVQKGMKIRSYTTSPSTQARIEALENGFPAKEPETVSPESNKVEKGLDGSDKMPNVLDDRTENENGGDGSTDNNNDAVTTFNTVQNMEMQAVSLDDSVGLPGVVPNEARLVKSPRQQNRVEVPDQIDNSLGEQPVNTDSTAN
eukprot:g5778.t1